LKPADLARVTPQAKLPGHSPNGSIRRFGLPTFNDAEDRKIWKGKL